jgi:predicted  nucleic acid-binding Zn-ribbon protein
MDNNKELFIADEAALNAYNSLAQEAEFLKDNMQTLMAKYKRALEIITKMQSKNTELERDLNRMKSREAILLNHIKSNLTEYMEQATRETIDERLIN